MIKANIITPDWLAERRKYAILIAFIASAILTPPDVISQIMLATPIILLYEISIFYENLMFPMKISISNVGCLPYLIRQRHALQLASCRDRLVSSAEKLSQRRPVSIYWECLTAEKVEMLYTSCVGQHFINQSNVRGNRKNAYMYMYTRTYMSA